jgi:hypothetical protein
VPLHALSSCLRHSSSETTSCLINPDELCAYVPDTILASGLLHVISDAVSVYRAHCLDARQPKLSAFLRDQLGSSNAGPILELQFALAKIYVQLLQQP